MSTGAVIFLTFLGAAGVLGALEWRTLTDARPDNHITAVVRRAVRKQPGPFVLLAFALGYLAGHLFWP